MATGETKPLPRWGLCVASLVHAPVFVAGAVLLPWQHATPFTFLALALALAHVVTAVAAATRATFLRTLFRATAYLSLAVFVFIVYVLLAGASYLAALYGALGAGVGAALALGLAPAALVTVPYAIWGIAATFGPSDARRSGAAAGLVLVLLAMGSVRGSVQARATPTARSAEDSADMLAAMRLDFAGEATGPRSLYGEEAIECAEAPERAAGTLLVAHLVRDDEGAAQVATACLQAPPDELVPLLAEHLAHSAVRGPVKIDWVTGTHPLGDRLEAIDVLSIRPAADGVCLRTTCVAPWQLVSRRAFGEHTPLDVLSDLRIGFSPRHVRAMLGDPAAAAEGQEMAIDGLVRIETRSFVFDERGGLHELERLRRTPAPLDETTLDEATRAAERYIVDANARKGRRRGIFRYMLEPHMGHSDIDGFNLPRQAGTTLALCELGARTKGNRTVVRRALRAMADMGRAIEVEGADLELIGLARGKRPQSLSLGPTALPAIAFLSCRDRVGDEFDETIAGMARFLLHAQRETGGFHPAIERTTGARVEGADPLFATGQAVFALTLVERMLLDEPELSARLDLPPVGVVHDAVERAMNFYAGPYWDFVLHDYFFLEENWHCLAARASLGHHRNDAYERFCLDYVGFKHRLMLIADREREADLVGGFGFSHLLPPHNTATAGYGEALAAKIEIARARGLDTGDDEAEMHDVIGFLIRQQLDEVECFACNSKISAVGAIGESMAVAEIRIDYVQHAWAAMGHGGRVLGLRHSR